MGESRICFSLALIPDDVSNNTLLTVASASVTSSEQTHRVHLHTLGSCTRIISSRASPQCYHVGSFSRSKLISHHHDTTARSVQGPFLFPTLVPSFAEPHLLPVPRHHSHTSHILSCERHYLASSINASIKPLPPHALSISSILFLIQCIHNIP